MAGRAAGGAGRSAPDRRPLGRPWAEPLIEDDEAGPTGGRPTGHPSAHPSIAASAIAGVVLAGGAARRMGGGDKPLLTIGGATMLARVLAALDLPAVAISANGDPARFARFGLPILPDGPFLGEGPLAGVLAALEWGAALGAEAVLTAPGDTPFLPPGLAAALWPAPSYAAAGEREHPLVALWPVSARTELRARLSRPGPRHAARFAAAIGARRVDFPPGSWDAFLNVNTPGELDAARAHASRTHDARAHVTGKNPGETPSA